MKQEYKVESLDTCISELQQQTYAQRSELEDAHHGYVESRREQVRPQEKLVMKERALRDTQIRNIHEMGEIKRAQELRVDEFVVQKLKESHYTIQRLTSQIQELQESVKRAVIPSPLSLPSRDKRLPLETWNLYDVTTRPRPKFLASSLVPTSDPPTFSPPPLAMRTPPWTSRSAHRTPSRPAQTAPDSGLLPSLTVMARTSHPLSDRISPMPRSFGAPMGDPTRTH